MTKLLALLGVLALFAANCCWAQANTASISGQITDDTGAVVSGSSVRAINTATGLATAVTTNHEGFYAIPNLPVGGFSMEVTAPGFKKYVRAGLTLTTAQILELNVKLQVGAVSETVEVTGEEPLVETTTSDVKQFIESKTISDVPLGNRKTMNVIQTLGGAVFLNDNVGGSQPTYSLAGGRVQSQLSFLDGAITQSVRLGVPQQSIDPPIDAVREIQVISSVYPAQYGGITGGVVIETSKSGTNRMHGSLYENLRNDAAESAGYFAPILSNGQKSKPALHYNIYGGTLGGPIKHNKAFFFFSWESVRLHQGSTLSLAVPSKMEQSGNFSQVLNTSGAALGVNACDGTTVYPGQIFDPRTQRVVGGITCRNAFPGNIITNPDPVGAKILSYYPVPTTSATSNTVTGNVVTMTNTDFYLAKVEDELSRRDHFSVLFMSYKSGVSASSLYPDPNADPNQFPTPHPLEVYGSETHTFGSNQVNNFGFTYYRRKTSQFGFAYNKSYPQKLGLTGVPEVSFPSILPSGYQFLGDPNQQAGSVLTQEDYLDDFSWVLGRHNLKLGGEFRGSRQAVVPQDASDSGQFFFIAQTTSEGSVNPTATGNSLASLYVGGPGGQSSVGAFNISNGLPTDRRSQYFAGYIQDDWTVSHHLTVNLGFRWEADLPELDASNRLNGFDTNQINPISGTPGVVKFAGIDYPARAWDGNWTNFSPRLGFAYKPFDNENTAIRGGWGIYYGPPIDNTTGGGGTLGFTQSALMNSPDTYGTPPFYLGNGVPAFTLASPALNDSFGAVAAPYTNATTAVSYFPRNRPTEYSHQINLTIEHQLSPTLVISASGLSNLGRHLSAANQSVDQITPSVLSTLAANHTTAGLQQYRPYPQFNGVALIAPSIGTTNYFALVLRVEKRYANGFNFASTYTQSKFLGNVNDNANASAGNLGNNAGTYSNYYNRAADYGPTENDIERRFTFNTVYELPFGPGRRWASERSILHEIVGGWSISNLTTIQSGPPVTPITSTNNTNAFSSGNQRPNLSGNPNLSRGKRKYPFPIVNGGPTWFDISVFSQPAAYTFGNEGVGVIRAPGYTDFDFSLLRNINLPKEWNLQLRIDAFNAFNETEPGLPNLTFGSPTFGQISSARLGTTSNRQMELGARLSF